MLGPRVFYRVHEFIRLSLVYIQYASSTLFLFVLNRVATMPRLMQPSYLSGMLWSTKCRRDLQQYGKKAGGWECAEIRKQKSENPKRTVHRLLSLRCKTGPRIFSVSDKFGKTMVGLFQAAKPAQRTPVPPPLAPCFHIICA